ncbi:S9 family peptidase [soil metagenome]
MRKQNLGVATPLASLRSSLPLALMLVSAWVFDAGGRALGVEDRALTPEDLTRLRVVVASAIHDDGKIAYLLAVPRRPFEDADGPAWTELHVVDREGRSRPFITGEENLSGLDWTPDGRGISFLARRGKDEFSSLYVIPIDGGEAKKMLGHKANIRSYAWSPEGDRVAFLANEEPAKADKDLLDKGFTQEIFEEDWKPVRVWIAQVSESNDDPEPKPLDLEGSASELSWGLSGDKLAVALAPTPGVDDNFMARRVRILDADSSAVLAEIDNPGKLGKVALSPDGEHVAMISGADIHDPAEGRLLVAPADGGDLRDLIPGYEGHISDFAWKDEKTIIFLGDEGAKTVLKQVGIENGDPKTLQDAGDLIATAFELAKDGDSAVLIGHADEHPAEVFLATAIDSEPKRLTDSNPWLDEIRFAEQEVITFKARDGLELEGILIRPLEAEESKRYPLILSVHGGPESHDRDGWLTGYALPGQVAAARGFAVLYPNYRGSTGRGVEFSKHGQGDPAGKEFDALVDAVDHLVEIGLVDQDKVGITGGSHGGYASAWGATKYSDRFAAAVMFVGISDKISKSGTTDIPEEEFLVHARKRPWDNWQFFLERSPIYHVEQAETPILILHGKDDPRVHPGQSLEMYRYLKLIDKAPVRLVLYPGEGHGNRRAASRYDYNLRMLQWMEHYLKEDGDDPPPHDLEYPLQKREEVKDDDEQT